MVQKFTYLCSFVLGIYKIVQRDGQLRTRFKLDAATTEAVITSFCILSSLSKHGAFISHDATQPLLMSGIRILWGQSGHFTFSAWQIVMSMSIKKWFSHCGVEKQKSIPNKALARVLERQSMNYWDFSYFTCLITTFCGFQHLAESLLRGVIDAN